MLLFQTINDFIMTTALYLLFIYIYISSVPRKNDFDDVSKNLTRYKCKNNYIGHSNWLLEC